MDDFIFIESLEAQMQAQGDKTALVFKGKETSYAQLSSLSNKVANALIKDGVKPRSRVAFMGNNSAIYFELLLGVQKTRAALVGVNSRLAPPEVAFVINDAQAEMIFVDRNYAPLIEKIIDDCPNVRRVIAMDFDHADWTGFADWRDAQSDAHPGGDYHPDDDIIQLYTSGTTGHPKGVQLTNSNMGGALHQASIDWGGWVSDDHVLLCMPLFHIAGVNVGLIGLNAGATVTVLPAVNPAEILRLIEETKVTILFMVPAVILFVMQEDESKSRDISSVRQVVYGASPIAEDLLVSAQQTFKCDFIQVYGLTETTGCATHLPAADHAAERGKLRSCESVASGRRTTHAFTASPHFSSGTPITATSAISG